MCGIFGFVAGKESSLTQSSFKNVLNDLFMLSESRGKEASGLAILVKGSLHIYKKPVPDKDKSSSRWLVYPITAAFGFVGGLARAYARHNGYEPIEITSDTKIHFLYTKLYIFFLWSGSRLKEACRT